jgi:hypothetical protein
MPFITGHFTAMYNGSNIGESEQGWEIAEAHLSEDILTDSGGDSPVDGVMRGTRHEVRGTMVEYDLVKAALYAANPRGTTFNNVGLLMTSLAKRLVMTPIVGTSAALELGASSSIVFRKAIILSDIVTLLANKNRKGPITFRCYPDPVDGVVYEIITTP